MEKRTKIMLGVGALAVVGYLVWKNNQPKDIFKNATGKGGLMSTKGGVLIPDLYGAHNGCPCKPADKETLKKANMENEAIAGWNICADDLKKMCKIV